MKENKLKNAMRFYLLATQLKYKIRSGWDEKHWNVSKERIESIAGACIWYMHFSNKLRFRLTMFQQKKK